MRLSPYYRVQTVYIRHPYASVRLELCFLLVTCRFPANFGNRARLPRLSPYLSGKLDNKPLLSMVYGTMRPSDSTPGATICRSWLENHRTPDRESEISLNRSFTKKPVVRWKSALIDAPHHNLLPPNSRNTGNPVVRWKKARSLAEIHPNLVGNVPEAERKLVAEAVWNRLRSWLEEIPKSAGTKWDVSPVVSAGC
jgi:hypothetical protein